MSNQDFETDEQDEADELMTPPAQLKARALNPGARVGLVAPGSRPESPLALNKAVRMVEDLGYKTVIGPSVLRYDGFSAGTDLERLDDLQGFLDDDSIEAIVCLSGGYGAMHLLPLLDFAKIRKHPKIFLGSGDNDMLLLAINRLTGLVVFHGQNLDEIDDKHSFESLQAALAGRLHERPVCCIDEGDACFESAMYSLSDAVLEGVLCGGNLSSLSSLFGTRYQSQLKDKILFLDDFNERNSILDRWFTTLYLAGTLKEIAALALGGFPGCGPRGADNMLSIEDTFGDRLKELSVPACFGFKFGLASKDNVMPIGVQARIDCGKGEILFLESSLN